MTHRIARALLAAAVCLPPGARAVGTAAGSDIRAQAEVSYELAGVPMSRLSNATTLKVVEVLDVHLLLQTAQRLVNAGADAQPLLYTLTNTGNGRESFALNVDVALGGDDFDPVTPPAAVYFDTDGTGTWTPADAAYVPGVNDPVLEADQSLDLFLVENIPQNVADGARGLAALQATATTGSGVPGRIIAGAGDTGVDAMIGTTGGLAVATGEYLVGRITLSLVKSAVVADAGGSARPEPGATIVYTIRVSATGTGSAEQAVLQDPIPAATSYVPGSLTLNGTPLSDAADADAGEVDASNDLVAVRLGRLGPLDGEQQVQFTVRIN